MKQFVVALVALSAILGCQAAPQARIAGGDDVVLGQIPYQAAVSFAGSPLCGAVILNENFALTAMRCVCSPNSDRVWPPQLFTLIAGSTDLYTGGVRIELEEIILNPNYSDFNNGLALLKLMKPLTFSDTIQPIALASQEPAVGANVDVSGWGRQKETDENMYRTLQVNDATIVETQQCNEVLGRSDSTILCLGHARKNGICRGDFGGPAVYENTLVGVAADVTGECGSMLPDVFTSVASHYDWIVEQMTP